MRVLLILVAILGLFSCESADFPEYYPEEKEVVVDEQQVDVVVEEQQIDEETQDVDQDQQVEQEQPDIVEQEVVVDEAQDEAQDEIIVDEEVVVDEEITVDEEQPDVDEEVVVDEEIEPEYLESDFQLSFNFENEYGCAKDYNTTFDFATVKIYDLEYNDFIGYLIKIKKITGFTNPPYLFFELHKDKETGEFITHQVMLNHKIFVGGVACDENTEPSYLLKWKEDAVPDGVEVIIDKETDKYIYGRMHLGNEWKAERGYGIITIISDDIYFKAEKK